MSIDPWRQAERRAMNQDCAERIAAAVAAEREACAKDCEHLSQHFGRHSEGWTAMLDAAAYIRARTPTTASEPRE